MSNFDQKKKTMMLFKHFREESARTPKNAANYLEELFDEGTFHEVFAELETTDPLKFPGYQKKLRQSRQTTGMSDALAAGYGAIGGIRVFAAKLDRNFLMGSMGTSVGEKLVRVIEAADRYHVPLIIFSASGGARMQEGMFSLVQMARTSAAIRRFQDHGGLYISVLTHPTTGGVSASFAMLGDIILAEEHALIGFAGPRVIEQTIGEKLPEGFQRAEFQLEHGFVDRVVRPEEMKDTILRILRLHKKRRVTPRPANAEA